MALSNVKPTIKNAQVDKLRLVVRRGVGVGKFDWRLMGRSTKSGEFRMIMANPSTRTKQDAMADLQEVRKAARSLDIPLQIDKVKGT